MNLFDVLITIISPMIFELYNSSLHPFLGQGACATRNKVRLRLTMKPDEIANVRELLIKFGRLSRRQQSEFLSAMNDFMFESPKSKKQKLLEWEKQCIAMASGSGRKLGE
jgi:hypothetical protein